MALKSTKKDKYAVSKASGGKRGGLLKSFTDGQLNVMGQERGNRWVDYIAICFLGGLGLLYSLHFLGHFEFPSSDFVDFLGTGKIWLNFETPGSMKRAPFFSIITVLLGKLFRGPDRYLFGTELYNAILLSASMVLTYFVGKKLVGRGAIWVAVLVGINSWMVRMSSQPLVELTMVVLFAAAVLCIATRPGWAYLFAMLCSISRWDMAGILAGVAIVDLAFNRKWGKTIIMTILASVPFGLCMLITKTQGAGGSGGGHYLAFMSEDWSFELLADLKIYCQEICSFFGAKIFHKGASGNIELFKGLNTAVFWLSAVLLSITFLTGCVGAFVRKQRIVFVMLITAVPYIIIHALWPYRLPRFCVPVLWSLVLIAAYGAFILWGWLRTKNTLKLIIIIGQLLLTVVFILWTVTIANTIDYAHRQCPVVWLIVTITSIVVVAAFFVMQLIYRSKVRLGWLVVPAFLVLSVFSNGATLGMVMGDGQTGIGYKHLGEWFYENAQEDDRMITAMSNYMSMYTGLSANRFVRVESIKLTDAKDFPSFIQQCQKRKITLIAWDSWSVSNGGRNRYYKLWGLDRIEVLSAPLRGHKVSQIGPCKLVQLLTEGSPQIAIYRIMAEM